MARNDADKTGTTCNNVANVVCHATVSLDDTQGSGQETATPEKSAQTKRSLAQYRQELTDKVHGRSEDTLWTLDPEVAWFDDQSVNTQPVTKKQGTYVVDTDEKTLTKSRSAAVGASPRVFRFEWATLWRHLSCYRIANAHDLYLVWLLRTTSDQWMLWAGMHALSTLLSYFREHRAELEARARPVYIERPNSDPLGSYAGTLAHSPRTLPAFFIQMYGVRNGVPCQQCESSYRRYVRLDESGAVLARVMVPVFECISLQSSTTAAAATVFTESRRQYAATIPVVGRVR